MVILGIIACKVYKQKEEKIKQFIVKYLVLFYLLSSYLNATHFHSSHEADADNCQVCIVAKVFQSADLPSEAMVLLSPEWFCDLHTFFAHSWKSTLLKGYYSTAPPFDR